MQSPQPNKWHIFFSRASTPARLIFIWFFNKLWWSSNCLKTVFWKVASTAVMHHKNEVLCFWPRYLSGENSPETPILFLEKSVKNQSESFEKFSAKGGNMLDYKIVEKMPFMVAVLWAVNLSYLWTICKFYFYRQSNHTKKS